MKLFESRFKEVTPEMIKRCTDDVEFYDKHGYFLWENKIGIWIRKNKEIIQTISVIVFILALISGGFSCIFFNCYNAYTL